METIIGILVVLWLIGWVGSKLGFFKDSKPKSESKEIQERASPLLEYDVIEIISKTYKAEFVGSIQNIKTALKYSAFNSAYKLTSRFIQNGLTAGDMYGKVVAISDTISSIDGSGDKVFIRIGDGRYYGVEGTGESQENMYTCCLRALSVEYAKTLMVKDRVLVIGILTKAAYFKKELQDAILLRVNDKYLAEVETFVRSKMVD